MGGFWHYYLKGIYKLLKDLEGEKGDAMFPTKIDANYFVYQGEHRIVEQVELGGKGLYSEKEFANAVSTDRNAKYNWSKKDANGTYYPLDTFEYIDGFEVLIADGDKMYAVIQEDSGSAMGERMFITSPLEHNDNGKELTYYFVAHSGGGYNTRMMENVGIPAGVNFNYARAHEFSGVADLSGMLAKNKGGEFSLKAKDAGHKKRTIEATVPINEKLILLVVQAHNFYAGIVEFFNADRGGQWMVYKPEIP